MSSSLSGGPVKEPKVTFRRPLYVHSQTEKLTELSKAWSPAVTKQSLAQHYDDSHRLRSHDQIAASHDHIAASHDHRLRSPHHSHVHIHARTTPSQRTIPTSPTLLTTSTTQPLTSIGRLPSRTHDLLKSVYRSSPSRSPSPPKSNPRSVFGRADFRHTKPHPPAASQSTSWPVVNGTQLAPKPKAVTRKTATISSSSSSTNKRRSNSAAATGRDNTTKLSLSDEQVSTLLSRIERQKQELAASLNRPIASAPPLPPPTSINPSPYYQPSKRSTVNTSVTSTVSSKRRKVATAPPPKGYTGFSSTSEKSISYKPKTHPLRETPPISSQAPPLIDSTHEQRWASTSASSRPVITPSSWRSGQALANKVLGKETKVSSLLSNQNAQELLRDIESSDEEEEEDSDDTNGQEKPIKAVKPVNPVRQVMELSESEFVSSVKRTRDYDREAVQRYMLSKQLERKRKADDSKAARDEAENERKRRLQELRERQKDIVTSNLEAQRRRREEEYPDSTDIHIHFESAERTYHSELPVSVSHSPSVVPPSHFTPRSSSLLSATPRSRAMVPLSSYLSSSVGSSASHPPPNGASSKPPVGGIRSSPRVSLSFSSVSHTLPTASLLTSPAVSIPVSSPTSVPASVHLPVSLPVSLPTSVPVSLPASLPTSIPVSPPTSVPVSLPVSPPTSVHLSASFPTSRRYHTQTVTTPSSRTVTGSSSREAKLLELHHSALSLRQRIESERRKLEVLTSSPTHSALHVAPPVHHTSSSVHVTSHPVHHTSSSVHVTSHPVHHTSSSVHVTSSSVHHTSPLIYITSPPVTSPVHHTSSPPCITSSPPCITSSPPCITSSPHVTSSPPYIASPTEIPGISDIYRAAALNQQREEEAAATKIQETWRSHTSHRTVQKSPRSEHSLRTPLVSRPVYPSMSTPVTLRTMPVTVTPPCARPPWQQRGGDHLSVINIYTRQQQERNIQLEQPTVSSEGSSTDHIQVSSDRGDQQEDDNTSVTTSSEDTFQEGREGEESEEGEEREGEEQEREDVDQNETIVSLAPVGSDTKSSSSSSSSSSDSNHVSAITPPGSPSFHDSFVTPPKAPNTTQTQQPQYSPQSLGLRLKAELNMLETFEQGVRQLEGVESAQAIAEAQQETVALAQLLQSQTRTHEHTVRDLTDRTKEKLRQVQEQLEKAQEETHAMTSQVKKLEQRGEDQAKAHMRQLEEETIRAHALSQQRLVENQSQLTSALLESTKQQFESAQLMAEGVARAAAESAVVAALKRKEPSPYESDFDSTSFETDSLTNVESPLIATSIPPVAAVPMTSVPPVTTVPTTSVPPVTTVYMTGVPSPGVTVAATGVPLVATVVSTSVQPVAAAGVLPVTAIPAAVHMSPVTTSEASVLPVVSALSPQLSGGSKSSRTSGTLTPVPSETDATAAARLDMSATPPAEEIEEESTLTSVEEEEREEGSGDIDEVSFRELLPSESHRRQRRKRLTSTGSDVSDIAAPSGEVSPVSVGEESFNCFVSRMARQYVKEEEMRAKHQAALLKLRERAIKEKSAAQLKWLSVKKEQVQKKKDDEAMPPLLRKEEGVLKKLKQEQAEIKRLQEVHRRASHDRKLLLLQQQDIARLRQSAQQYKEKIKRYRAMGREGSPRPDYSPSPSPSPAPSPSLELHFEEFSEDSKSTSLNDSPRKAPSSITEELAISSQSPIPSEGAEPDQLEPPSKRRGHSYKLMKLQQSSDEKERYLEKFEQKLKKRRQTAEELLSYKQELLKKEEDLKQEEANITLMIEEGLKDDSFTPVTSEPKTGSARTSRSITEQVQTANTGSVPEELLESLRHTSVEYSSSTFETEIRTERESTTSPLTSTPYHPALAVRAVEEDSTSVTSEGIEQERRVLELQDQLRQKEQELKRKEIEQRRRKKELLVRQEKEIQARLKEVESALKHYETTSITQSVPLITVHSPSAATAHAVDLPAISVAPAVATEFPANAAPVITVDTPVMATGIPAEATGMATGALAMTTGIPAVTTGMATGTLAMTTGISAVTTGISAVTTGISAVDTGSISPMAVRDVLVTATASAPLPATGVHVSKVKSPSLSPISTTSSVSTVISVSEHKEESDELTEFVPLSPLPSQLEQQQEMIEHTSPVTAPQPAASVSTAIAAVNAESDTVTPITASQPVASVTAVAPVTALAPVTVAPVTVAPVTVAPTTAPQPAALVTVTPVTAPQPIASVTVTPVTASQPVAPITAPQLAASFTAVAPVTALAPVTVAPVTVTPVTAPQPIASVTVAPSITAPQLAAPVVSVLVSDEQDMESDDKMSTSYTQSFEQLSTLSPRPSPSPLSLTPDIPENASFNFAIGQRVLVGNSVQGTVRYIGETSFATGTWIGIELDEARGKNDGSVNDRRYFTCAPRSGVFAPPSKVIPLDKEPSSENSSMSEEMEESLQDSEAASSPQAISPEPLMASADLATAVAESMSDSLTTVSQLSGEEEPSGGANDTLVDRSQFELPCVVAIKKDRELPVDSLTQELVVQLSNEAFKTVHKIWKEKKGQDGQDKDATIDHVTDQLLTALVQSEVDLVCNIRDTKEALIREEKTSQSTMEVKQMKERGVSFSSEPLALVPSNHQQVNRIVEYVWNTLKDSKEGSGHCQLKPPQELLNELCNKTGVMLSCEKAFVHLVFDLAVHVIDSKSRPGHLLSQSCSSLELIQERVHTLLHQGKRPVQLPSLRYLHGNRRPGGKEVDFIDSLLLRELRVEEPGWVNYSREEELVRQRTTDEILNFLLDETVEVIENIYNKRKQN